VAYGRPAGGLRQEAGGSPSWYPRGRRKVGSAGRRRL